MRVQLIVPRASLLFAFASMLVYLTSWDSVLPKEPQCDSIRLHVDQLKDFKITGRLGGDIGTFHNITACWRFEIQRGDWWHLHVLTIDDVKCDKKLIFGESCVEQSGLGLHPPTVGTESQYLSARVYETVGTTGNPANYLNEIGEKQSAKMNPLEVNSILHIVKGKKIEGLDCTIEEAPCLDDVN